MSHCDVDDVGLVGFFTSWLDWKEESIWRKFMLMEILLHQHGIWKSFCERMLEIIIHGIISLLRSAHSLKKNVYYKCGLRVKMFFTMIALNGKTTGHWHAHKSLLRISPSLSLHVVVISFQPTCQPTVNTDTISYQYHYAHNYKSQKQSFIGSLYSKITCSKDNDYLW